MRKFWIFCTLFLASLVAVATDCPNIPLPHVTADTVKICHTAYISLYDVKAHVPRVVAYELTREQSLGCLPRASGFHAEGPSAKPSEFVGTHQDLGHMMSAEDASWNAITEYESFSMVNVAPQEPELNRQQWERLEESVRAWAWARGAVIVYVGPILSSKPKTIGKGIAVPDAFFKIIVDKSTGTVLAFEMPQKAIVKGDLQPWIFNLAKIEIETGMTFNLNCQAVSMWSLDLPGWRAAHRKACSK
jgi:endonuclease G